MVIFNIKLVQSYKIGQSGGEYSAHNAILHQKWGIYAKKVRSNTI